MDASHSTNDKKYQIKFQDITNQKPKNMTFQMRGKNQLYSSLQELENDLQGTIEKKSKKIMIIDWQWNYESGEQENSIRENDKMDTIDGKTLESYQFRILVTGEEVL